MLSCACIEDIVVEAWKNESLGGRASSFEEDGFRRDMGPSRYLMPDLFEQFFDDMGKVAKFGDWSKEWRVREPDIISNKAAEPLRRLWHRAVHV